MKASDAYIRRQSIGSNTGAWSGRHKGTFWTNTGILSNGPLETTLAAIFSRPHSVNISCRLYVNRNKYSMRNRFIQDQIMPNAPVQIEWEDFIFAAWVNLHTDHTWSNFVTRIMVGLEYGTTTAIFKYIANDSIGRWNIRRNECRPCLVFYVWSTDPEWGGNCTSSAYSTINVISGSHARLSYELLFGNKSPVCHDKYHLITIAPNGYKTCNPRGQYIY